MTSTTLAAAFALTSALLLAGGCGSTKPAGNDGAAAPATATTAATPNVAASADSSVTGKVAPGSKFAKITPGMMFADVTGLIGAPNDMNRHETGKRWIPFYFGSDVQRMQALYKGEGCLTFTGGNQFGGGGNELIHITADPSGNCWK